MPRISRADLRLFFFGIFLMLGMCALIARLWILQVMNGEAYAKKIGSSSLVTLRIPSVRGEIRDRNGIPLVQNRASYNVDFYLPDMVRGYRQRVGKLPLIVEQQPVHGMLKDIPGPDIVKIVNSGVIPRLEQLDLAHDYNAKRLKKHYKNDTLVPYTYIEDIDFPTIAKFSEHDVGLPGVDIDVRPVRQYLYGAFAAHLLGYVGMPRQIQDLPDVKQFNFYQPDVEGKNQIELTMDKYLRGKPGTRYMQRNAKGVIDSEVKMEPPQPGNNVYLTLDARIQYITEQALRHPMIGRAAAVVLDPNNGDILAMASVPSFDPNIFIPSVDPDDWGDLMKNTAVPLCNRAVSGFPPGSTFKIVTALAGLRKGIGSKKYDCPGGIPYGDHVFHCWIAEKHGSHGMLGLADAIKVSCDCFFYQYGNAAGIQAIDDIGDVLGFGRKYDIGLTDEKEGSLPGPDWMAARYPKMKWSDAQTANASIGQGYVLASPLQLAVAYAAVANGGIVYEPRLVRTVLTPDGKPVLDENGAVAVPDQPKMREDLRKEVSPEQIELVRHGLWEVVNERGGTGGGGTGSSVQIKGVTVAGKTGTAQASDRGKREHIAWLACFAPYDKPKYVVVAMVQGGNHGGGVAGPVAQRILSQALDLADGKLNVKLTKLEPANNPKPFEQYDALSKYADDPTVTATDAGDNGDGESADSKEPSEEKVQMSADEKSAKPDIRDHADDQGKVRNKHRDSQDQPERSARRAEAANTEENASSSRQSQANSQPRTSRGQTQTSEPTPRRNIFERFFHTNRKPTPAPASPR